MLWVSKLQTGVALNTLHAENVDLSQSTRIVFLLKTLCIDVIKVLGLEP